MPASAPDPAAATNRSRWMRQGRECMAARDWAGAIRAYGQGLLEQPLLGMHYAANLERARSHYRQERHTTNHRGPAHTQVVVAAAELSHNAAGRAFTLAQLYQHMGHPVELLGSHFPQWGRELWEPIRTAVQKAQLPVHTFVAEHEPRIVEQAFALVLQHPADLVHLSKPRLPAVVIGLLYKLLWGAAVLVDIDDEELCFVGEREPITLDGLKRLCHGLPEPRELMGPLWTRLAVDLAQRFDGITVANGPLQERYGGTVIPHARDPEQLRPATAAEKVAARQRFGVPLAAKVVLFFGTPKRHKGLLPLAEAVAQLPQALQPLLVVAGGFAPEDAALQQELEALLPAQRLVLLGNQPFEQAGQVLALADLVVLLSKGEVAAFQSPAKLSDALAMGLPVLVSEAVPLRPLVEQGWVCAAEPQRLARQLQQLLSDAGALQAQGQRARLGFEATLATPAVAQHLHRVAHQALADPQPANGRMINALESLHHRISSPLMAHRYRQWSKRLIDWQALEQRERDPELVSIVVPVYGDPAELDGCLESVRQAATRWRWELIAVMNDDAADSRAVLERHAQADGRIRAVWPGENVQFALGCNLGFSASQGEWLILLNNDCRVSDGWIDGLIGHLKSDSTLAAVQPRLVKDNGLIQCLGVVFTDNQTFGYPLYQGLKADQGNTRRNYKLSALTGACLAMRCGPFSALQGFDAVFINGQEDVDLCLRRNDADPRLSHLSITEVTVVHSEGHSPARYSHAQWNRTHFHAKLSRHTEANDQAIYDEDGMVATAWINRIHTGYNQIFRTKLPVLKPAKLAKVSSTTGYEDFLSIQLLRMAYPSHPALQGIASSHITPRSIAILKEAQAGFPLFRQDPQLQAVLGNWCENVQDGCWYKSDPDINRPFGVNLIGHARNVFGIGEDIRMAALALQRAEVPFCVIDHPAANGTSTDDHTLDQWIMKQGEQGAYLFNLVCMAAPVHARWLLAEGTNQAKDCYTISAWPWETETWPANWHGILDQADEYWSSSSLICKALSAYASKLSKEVRIQPMAVEIENINTYLGAQAKASARARFGMETQAFIILCTFDPRSTITRKNPDGAIRAFKEAFAGNNKKVALYIKCLKATRVTKEMHEFYQLCTGDPRIHLIEENLSREDLLTLYAACNCLLSLHRSEGYGRNIFEARLLGLQVLATGYGGFTDAGQNESDFYIDYAMRRIEDGEYPQACGHHWAEPDLHHAASQLQEAYTRFQFATNRRNQSKRDDLETIDYSGLHEKNNVSAIKVGCKYKERLSAVLSSLVPKC